MSESRSIGNLAPREFENLIFDLVQKLGIENLTWRTPGADGGRDIEGYLPVRDLSGGLTVQRWFIECKRYAKSVDWPTVWNKAAFAQNHDADYLLFAVTSSFSPTCETEVQIWNESKKQPIIRVWRGYELDSLIWRFPEIAVKYRLSDSYEDKDRGFLSLAIECAKFAQSAYSASEIGVESKYLLETAAALSELLSARMQDLSGNRRISILGYDPNYDGYDWLEATQAMRRFDRFGMRAILSVYRATLRPTAIVADEYGSGIMLHAIERRNELSRSSICLLELVAFWSDLEISVNSDSDIVVSQQDRSD